MTQEPSERQRVETNMALTAIQSLVADYESLKIANQELREWNQEICGELRSEKSSMGFLDRQYKQAVEVITKGRAENELLNELNKSQARTIAIGRLRLAAQLDGFRAANTRLDEQVNRQACTIEEKNEVLAERDDKISNLEKTEQRLAIENIRLRDLIKSLSIFKSSVTPTC